MSGPSQYDGDLARLIVESSNDVIIAKGLDGIVRSWNRAASAVYGYTAEEMIGRPMTLLLPPARIADEEKILSKIERGEFTAQSDTMRRRKDGTEIRVSILVSPLRDAAGGVIGALHVERDITHRLHADELVRAAVESAPAAMIMADANGQILLVNALTESIFGYQRDELIGEQIEILLPERYRGRHPRLRDAFTAAPSARQMGVGRELFGLRKGGAEFPVEVGLTPIRTSLGLCVLCAVVDITERRRTEDLMREQHEALLASERRFYLAINGTEAGLWDWNPQTDEVYLSPRFKEILGYSDEELSSDAGLIRDNIHPDDLARRNKAMEAHLKSGGRYDIDYRVLTKSGEYRWVNARATALRDIKDNPYRVVGWIMDISARKQSEEHLAAYRQQLRNLNIRSHVELEAERVRIAREVHDELGQNLTAIKLDLHWLDRKAHEEKDSALREEMSGRIRETAALADKTTLAIQRIAMELRPGTLDYLGLAAAVRDEAKRFGVRAGIEIVLDVPDELEALDGDVSTAVFRVLQELLTNVARHAKAKSVRISLDTAGGLLMLDVQDDGIGMAPEAAQHATSLGLLGIRERLSEHGGRIAFLSVAGEGTHAKVRIPLTDMSELEDGDG